MSDPERLPDRDGQTFARLAEPLRRELKVHCYRMLGSLHEAEDAVQETYLRAWRSFGSFDGRGTLRAWLYRIATSACLDALAGRKRRRRILPDRHAPPTRDMPDGVPVTDIAWLEPYPDAEIERVADEAPSPEARYGARQATKLAFVALLQHLPPRQRAALLLCDVLGWSAAEAAAILGGTLASINSALQRARATLAAHRDDEPAKSDAPQKALLENYLRAWETLDLDGFVSLLKQDAAYTMPPLAQWYRGRDDIRRFFAWAWGPYEGFRLVPTSANGQPAFAAYARAGSDGAWTAHSLHVLALERRRIAAITLFAKPMGPRLFPPFGLPPTLAGA